MALLNQLFSEQDLAKMTNDQREFLVERIDNMLHDNDIRTLIASKLQHAVTLVAPHAKILSK